MSRFFPNCEKRLYLLLSASLLHFRGLLRSKVWTMEKHLAPELGGWKSQWWRHYWFMEAKGN